MQTRNILGRMVLCVAVLSAGLTGVSVGADPFSPLSLRSVQLGGEMGRRIDVTVANNLLALDADKDFLVPFAAKTGHEAGYVGLGKLIDAAVLLAAYTNNPDVMTLKDRLVNHVLEHQEADGYPGLFPASKRMSTLWDVHEVQYIVWGLLSDYEQFGRKESLDGARRAADYLIANWSKLPPDWGKDGVAPHVAVTGLERTMVALHRVTRDAKYLDFVCRTRKLPEWDFPIVIGRRPGIEGHMYAYLARTLAQLELHRINGDPRLLQNARRATEFMLHDDGLMLTGGGGQWEIWTDDQDGRGELGETCATAYQLRVYDALLRRTADAMWGDVMERTIYNTLFAAQSPDGRRLRYFAPTEGPRTYHPTDTYCCPCNYRRIVAELPTFVCYATADGAAINLYAASQAKVTFRDDDPVTLCQETDYPSSGVVKVQVTCAKPTRFTLQLRIPKWAMGTQVSVNGQAVAGPIDAGRFLPIDREWKPGDTVTLDMPMPFRLIAGRRRQAGRVAVMRGPLVFCLNPAQHEGLKDMDGADLGRIVLAPETTKAVPDNSIRPGGVACKVHAWMPSFSIAPVPEFEITLTEFPDPDGKQTYFRLRDMKLAVPDELFRGREPDAPVQRGL
jgi:DUF1680 family protein